MCPDHQLISVYFDGELPSPWKEKMESHIAGCPLCSERLNAYRLLSIGPAAEEEDALKAAQNRVWQNIGISASPIRTAARAMYSGAIWQRRLSVPVPAAAAAALLIITLAFFWIVKPFNTTEIPAMARTSETDFETFGNFPVADMQDLLQYLSDRDNGEVVVIRMPESRNFVNYGEPAIIKAADYSRTITGRRRP